MSYRSLSLLAALALATPALSRGQNVNLGETLAGWGYGKDAAAAADTGRWTRSQFTVEAEKNRRHLSLGGVRLYIGYPIVEDNSRLYIARRDLDKTVIPVLAPRATPAPPRLKTIVLDAGHGGKDPGKQNFSLGLNEKVVALDVVQRLRFILESRGYRVFVTRNRDSFIELNDRSAFANRQKADLFISVHFNAGPANVTGVETYCLTPAGQHSTNDAGSAGDTSEEFGNRNDPWNVLLGYYVQKTLVDKLDADDRGVRRARFAVLRDIACPGVLIECGFMSNPGEAAKIGTPIYREKLAQGIADAVGLYHNRVTRLVAKPAAKPTAKK